LKVAAVLVTAYTDACTFECIFAVRRRDGLPGGTVRPYG
jgi:hypothetical protein